MTKERRLAAAMWRYIASELCEMNEGREFDYKYKCVYGEFDIHKSMSEWCRLNGVTWRNSCYFCHYCRQCEHCPLAASSGVCLLSASPFSLVYDKYQTFVLRVQVADFIADVIEGKGNVRDLLRMWREIFAEVE